eukprot:NODE_10012_length_1383_cov_3.036624.p1 GENE.NODE_10012_length_1383_cov_3.036624~~NODE_10012_length_1383_cov_3.036624.p1  ORF type:complete len:310 (+),score=92.29 NODE_10012_length_1383_cov_3.036624:144-1073(+)
MPSEGALGETEEDEVLAFARTSTGNDSQTVEEEEEEEEDDDDDDDEDGGSRQRLIPEKLSPLDIRFSQMRARHEFRDARPLQQAVDLIVAVRVPEAGLVEEGGEPPAVWELRAPFPLIQIYRWRCKLRDEATGRPLRDPSTGGELYDSEERLFTLDNRRLHCLQRAAVEKWPERCVVDVLRRPPGPLDRSRTIRKFRTLDRGRSVLIGSRTEGESLVRWSWRAAVGLPATEVGESESSDPAAGRVQLRSLQRRRPRGGAERRPSGKRGAETVVAEEPSHSRSSWTSALVFFGVYFLLRVWTFYAYPKSG